MQLRVIQYCPHPIIAPEQAASKGHNAQQKFQGKKSSEGILTYLKPACTMELDVWSKLIGCSTTRFFFVLYVAIGYQSKCTQQEESLRRQASHKSYFQQIPDEINWLLQSHPLLTILFSTLSQSPPDYARLENQFKDEHDKDEDLERKHQRSIILGIEERLSDHTRSRAVHVRLPA